MASGTATDSAACDMRSAASGCVRMAPIVSDNTSGVELAFGHQRRGLGGDGAAGVRGLFVAHGGGVGDVDGGPAHHADIGHG